jgi:hypothetical protein
MFVRVDGEELHDGIVTIRWHGVPRLVRVPRRPLHRDKAIAAVAPHGITRSSPRGTPLALHHRHKPERVSSRDEQQRRAAGTSSRAASRKHN